MDARTDLFSFRVLLDELATGIRPFRGEASGVMTEAILNRRPVPPIRLNPDLPPKLEEGHRQGARERQDMRYQSGADLRTDLLRLKRDSDSARLPAATGAVIPVGEQRRSMLRRQEFNCSTLCSPAQLCAQTRLSVGVHRPQEPSSVTNLHGTRRPALARSRCWAEAGR